MKISINKESSIPIRDQLVEQISLQIASGMLESREKLPSIRALASRLGIHYSTVTAAYNHLAEVGLLEIRQGSGVRVAATASPREGGQEPERSIEEMFQEFLARCSEAGYALADVRETVAGLAGRQKVKRLLAVDRNVDFHEVIRSELAPHFEIPVEVCTVEEIKDIPNPSLDAMIITSLYHLFAFQSTVPDKTRLVPCNIEPARAELARVEELRAGSLVMLVSVSPTLMTMATKLVAAARGEEIAVRSVLASDDTELEYLVKYADLILCDSPSEEKTRRLAGPQAEKKLRAFKLYSPSTIELVKERLAKWG